jgi:hypothetical protein
MTISDYPDTPTLHPLLVCQDGSHSRFEYQSLAEALADVQDGQMIIIVGGIHRGLYEVAASNVKIIGIDRPTIQNPGEGIRLTGNTITLAYLTLECQVTMGIDPERKP